MPKYRVSVYATPEGALHMNSSVHRYYTVEAETEQAARIEAINVAYREGGVEHVNPRKVERLA